jgi:hypothetical protein
MQQGDYATARALFREVLALMAVSRNEENWAIVPEAVAELVVYSEQPRQGVRLLGFAASVRKRAGIPIRPYERADYERREQLLRAALDAETFAEAWESGLAMTMDEALALAQEIL